MGSCARHGCVSVWHAGTDCEEAQNQGRVFIVDVGGAVGGTMKELKEACPELEGRIVVQDKERVIKAIPKGFLPGGVEARPYDIWTPQPVKGAKVYYFRRGDYSLAVGVRHAHESPQPRPPRLARL